MEVAAHIQHEVSSDRLPIGCETVDERVVANDADGSRDALRVLMNREYGLAREQLFGLPARYPDSGGYVCRRFTQIEGGELAAQRNPLFQLAEPRIVKPLGELRLTDQCDGQRAVRRPFDIRKKPDFLEQLVGQTLGLVDDECQDRVVLSPMRNGPLKVTKKTRLRSCRFRRKSKFRSQKFE